MLVCKTTSVRVRACLCAWSRRLAGAALRQEAIYDTWRACACLFAFMCDLVREMQVCTFFRIPLQYIRYYFHFSPLEIMLFCLLTEWLLLVWAGGSVRKQRFESTALKKDETITRKSNCFWILHLLLCEWRIITGSQLSSFRHSPDFLNKSQIKWTDNVLQSIEYMRIYRGQWQEPKQKLLIGASQLTNNDKEKTKKGLSCWVKK